VYALFFLVKPEKLIPFAFRKKDYLDIVATRFSTSIISSCLSRRSLTALLKFIFSTLALDVSALNTISCRYSWSSNRIVIRFKVGQPYPATFSLPSDLLPVLGPDYAIVQVLS
jgi:hypothetical protein